MLCQPAVPLATGRRCALLSESTRHSDSCLKQLFLAVPPSSLPAAAALCVAAHLGCTKPRLNAGEARIDIARGRSFAGRVVAQQSYNARGEGRDAIADLLASVNPAAAAADDASVIAARREAAADGDEAMEKLELSLNQLSEAAGGVPAEESSNKRARV